MSFFATSAQISASFNVPHEKVLQAIDNMPHESFKEEHIQIFDIGNDIAIAQMTEPGYNAVIFYLPISEESREQILQFRESLFLGVRAQNKTTSTSTGVNENTIDDNAREEMKRLIATGEYDANINKKFTEIHRELIQSLGANPGYQNVRAVVIQRRAQLNIDDTQ